MNIWSDYEEKCNCLVWPKRRGESIESLVDDLEQGVWTFPMGPEFIRITDKAKKEVLYDEDYECSSNPYA